MSRRMKSLCVAMAVVGCIIVANNVHYTGEVAGIIIIILLLAAAGIIALPSIRR
jgi:hypothetical protein